MLLGFLAWALYPAWLLAGAADYIAHRRSDIAHTSGTAESWLHVAQLICIAAAFVPAVLFEITAGIWIWMLAAVLLHSALAYVDVNYTDGRRYISPFEEHVHGFLDVIPLVAVGLLGVINWPQISAGEFEAAVKAAGDDGIGNRVLLLSFAILAGVPVVEELIRALRARPRAAHASALTTPASSRR